ncbi:pentapeptide repeat-containing protein [Nostoc sp. TCL26-01]|uniref:pentapeptide repeat-containing protein n=1 Tax=Nostoc sp. TCL26-01 TaxID=2576904 RepID=UPI00211753FD|nr:pentapeptide repeat-containing protein [Nostoc sp. TCL26-01]
MIKSWLAAEEIIKDFSLNDLPNWQREQDKVQSIDKYLKTDIAPKPFELVFVEKFAIKDIYIPPKAKLVDASGEIFNLETWVKTILLNPDNLDKVIFIQGNTGRGKSVFCRMFAYTVWRQLHPIWTPILIHFRDIDTSATSLLDIIQAKLQFGLIQNDENWLTNPHTRFLFILDGCDELPHNINLAAFIQQVAEFQQICTNNPEMGHRVMITGGAIALQHIAEFPDNLARVEIVPLDAQLQQQWLNKWTALPTHQGKEPNFLQFLLSHHLADAVNKLAQEPPFLYLLAAMYQDGKLDIHQLGLAKDETTAKINIYQQAIHWLISKSELELNHSHLNHDFTKHQPEAVKRLLAEAAICVVQSGNKSAAMSMLEARLSTEEILKQKLLNKSLKQTLATLCIHASNTPVEGVEFFHQRFSKFLFAERLKTRFKAWTQYYDADEGRVAIIAEDLMNWEIYDLLGYGGLTQEIVDYLMGLLTASQDFPWVELYTRLETFHRQWSRGKFIDSADETLPQKKLRQLQRYGIKGLGQREIDIFTGLNVIILLLELHRYAQAQDHLQNQIIFYPSGQPKENSWTDKLRPIINYSDSIRLETFNRLVGQFLVGVNLPGANLTDTDFSNVDLSNANLNAANLCGATLFQTRFRNANLSHAYIFQAYFGHADISGANLSYSFLSHTDMSYANLSHVNFSGADLRGADLSDTNFSGANLSNADLSGANLSNADLSGTNFSHADLSDHEWGDIHWNENTIWQNIQGLDTAKNVPAALKQQLGLN